MRHTALRWFTVFALMLAPLTLPAQETGTAQFDLTFGNAGFAPLPQVAGSAPGNMILGFVHPQQSSGHLVFSVQVFGGTPRIVSHRLLDNGAVDTGYGINSSLIYALPVPDGVGDSIGQMQFRIVTGVRAGVETVFLVYKFSGNYLAVARLGANGGLIDFTATNLPVHFGQGVGQIRDVAYVPNIRTGYNGLVIAVHGKGSDLYKIGLIKYEGGTFYENFSAAFNRLNLSINRILLRADGNLDVIGTAAGKAYHIPYNYLGNSLGTEHYFDLHCVGSLATASVLDDIVRDPPLGAQPLVIGRAQCSTGGQQVVVARVSGIESAPVTTGNIVIDEDLGGCNTLTDPCLTMAQISHGQPGRIYATTPNIDLAIIDLAGGSGAPRLTGSYSLYATHTGDPFVVLPTRKFGVHQDHPRLTGIAIQMSTFTFGIGRIFIGTLFSDGFED